MLKSSTKVAATLFTMVPSIIISQVLPASAGKQTDSMTQSQMLGFAFVPLPLMTICCLFVHRYNFQTKKLHTLTIDNALYHDLAYLLYNSKTYFKLAADENGLWLIFASSSVDESIMVAELDQKTFSVTSYINTTYPRTKAGNAFIACGVLYVTDTKDTRVTFAFDLLKGKPVNMTFDLRSPGGVLAMLSYSPKDRHLYVWDQSYVRLYVVHFITDE